MTHKKHTIHQAILLGGISGMTLFNALSLSPISVFAETPTNLIPNSSLDATITTDSSLPQYFKTGDWGVNDATFVYPISGPMGNGDQAAKVTITTYTNGDAKWYFNDVVVIPGAEYIFRDRYLSDVPADIIARYTKNDDSYRYAYLGTSVISAKWTGYQTLPFTIPADTISMTVFHLIHETGELSVDDFSLMKVADLVPIPTSTATIKSENTNGAVPLFYITGVNNPKIKPATALSSVPTITEPIKSTTVENSTPKKETNVPTPKIVASAISAETMIASPINQTSIKDVLESYRKADNNFTFFKMEGISYPMIIAMATLLILGGISAYLFLLRTR